MPRLLRRAALLVALAACEGEPDPLDADVLQQLARAQGDAEGDAFAGLYLLVGEAEGACDCPKVQGFDLCVVLSLGAGVVPVDAAHYDGLLVLDLAETVAYVGGVDRGGDFAVAAIVDASLIAATGDLHSRIDGAFTDRAFTGVLQNRLVGTYLGDPIDCRARVALTADRFDL